MTPTPLPEIVPAGTQVVATVNFRVRTVSEGVASDLKLEVVDVSGAAGEPIRYGTAVEGGSVRILGASGTLDNNANGSLDVGDAILLLRLIARLDTVRPWDIARNDLNGNGVLDSGDAVKLLKWVAAAEAPGPLRPASVSPKLSTLTAALPEQVVLAPARLRGEPGQVVTFQVCLADLSAPVAATDFVLSYPAAALRLARAPRPGPWLAADSIMTYNDNGAGRVRVVISSPAPSDPSGVLAELSFEVLPGAGAEYAWSLGLTWAEGWSDGYTERPLATGGAALIGRSPAPAQLSGMQRTSGAFGFSLRGETGADYVVEASEDLVTWSPWRTITAGADALEILDTETATHPQRFYRVRPAE